MNIIHESKQKMDRKKMMKKDIELYFGRWTLLIREENNR